MKFSLLRFLLIASILFTILRLPSLIEPDWYGDEGIYQVMGQAMNAGRVLYRDIWDNKPPLLYMIYALFNGDLFFVKLLSLISGLGGLIVFFFLAKDLFKNEKSVYISTVFFALMFGLPILEGNIANAENFMLFPILLSCYLLFKKRESTFNLAYILSGLFLAVAFLFKIVAVFDLAAFIVTLLILKYFETKSSFKMILNFIQDVFSKKILTLFKQELLLIISFLLPIVLFSLYFVLNNAFYDFLRATFSQNVGYVGWGNQFIFPLGGLIIKALILTLAILVIINFRQKLNKNGVLIFVWLAFSTFNALFSQRPYGHYLLVVLAALSLFLGYTIENKRLIRVNVLIALLTLLVLSNNFNLIQNSSLYKKVFYYYGNYLQFLSGNKSVSSYQAFFDKNTPRDYDIANFIIANTTKEDSVLLISDSGQIYSLAKKLPPGRYIVSYHMTFYKDAIYETQEDIKKVKPKYIITTKESSEFAPLLLGYSLKYSMSGVKIHERKI